MCVFFPLFPSLLIAVVKIVTVTQIKRPVLTATAVAAAAAAAIAVAQQLRWVVQNNISCTKLYDV